MHTPGLASLGQQETLHTGQGLAGLGAATLLPAGKRLRGAERSQRISQSWGELHPKSSQGEKPPEHKETRQAEGVGGRESLRRQQLVALYKIPSPQKYHLDDKTLNLARYRVTNTMRGGSRHPSCLEPIQLL